MYDTESDITGLEKTDNGFFGETKDFFHDIYVQATYFQFEGRDAENINLPTYEEAISNPNEWVQLPASMNKYHDNKTGSSEIKFVHADGREAVFTKDRVPGGSSDGTYQLYTDPKYKGTFNYVTPTNLPTGFKDVKGLGEFIVFGLGHIVTDVVPFKLVGGKNARDQK